MYLIDVLLMSQNVEAATDKLSIITTYEGSKGTIVTANLLKTESSGFKALKVTLK